MSTSSRGTLDNVCLAGACAHIGALVYLAGVTEPDRALALLAEKHHLTGKKTRTSVLYTYPSYLGELIECGLAGGYRPADFGLCRMRHLPATSRLLGKLGLSVRHECGWTYPRQLAEALEALEEVPLPARYGYWAVPWGVAIEVVVRKATLEDRSQLRNPLPLRGDLREQVFGTLKMDRPLTSERSLPQAAEEMR